MTRTRLLFVCAQTILFSAACSKTKKPTTAATVTPAPTAMPAAQPAAAKPASPSVGVSDDLAKQCSLRFSNATKAPRFDYNDTDLLPSDREVLQQVADCLVKGPLQGRSVQLVGRADPRGTDEYNLGLGNRRAENVRVYLERLGVPAKRMTPTTRGEIDATGSDENGWQLDRRVDLQLVN